MREYRSTLNIFWVIDIWAENVLKQTIINVVLWWKYTWKDVNKAFCWNNIGCLTLKFTPGERKALYRYVKGNVCDYIWKREKIVLGP